MSGYLQRIVTQAKAPAAETRIRPLVRPMYAAYAAASFGDVHEEIAVAGSVRGDVGRMQGPAEVRTTRRTGQLSGHEVAASSGAPFSDEEGSTMASHEVLHEGIQSQRIEPLMPKSGRANVSGAVVDVGSQMDHADVRVPIVSAATATTNVLRVATGTIREHQPLMPRQARPIPSAAMQSAPAQVAQVSDEIHINIGRIEVTAVPQGPAPRPAARAPRRAFSLDEYLRKSDGRAQ